jgi:hypothetical protein
MPDLTARILQTVREYNGQLDWQGLAVVVGVDPRAVTGALQQAGTALHRDESVRLEFDEHGIVRFWTV